MSGKEQLDALRQQIDEVDERLIPLFVQRMDAVQKVAQVKQENNLAVLDAKREAAILQKASTLAGEEMRGEISLLMRALLALSKNRQRRAHFGGEIPLLPPARAPKQEALTCVYQGMPGAWSEQALAELFPTAKQTPVEQFEDVFTSVRQGLADYGIVPIENSQTGAIGETYDLLRKYGCFIVGRTTIEVKQCLLGTEDAAIEHIQNVYSHPEALSQCRRYLQKNHWEEVPCRNTAVAAKQVAEKKDATCAAIASVHAAHCYGLQVLEKDIMDSSGNRTSFIVIAAEPEYEESSTMVTVTFSTAHRSGALCELLLPFMAQDINLARIESRPGTAGSYRFFADLEGNIQNEQMVFALRQAAAAAEYFEVLGCYSVR
ncbi:chorismate mutase [Ruminococcaceae bacterium OttesenSCG-928-I18]|nr:chorismate mutase [Ruminococcaceae bacterium OttesenSCG-928-I18]